MAHEWIAFVIFSCVVGLILWRPWRINVTVPASLGALAVLALGYINLSDVRTVLHIVSGPAVITFSTIIMSSILDRAGFFRWAAQQIAVRARGSGKRLFVYVMAVSCLMTLFFNNDGSILITTPIFVELTKNLKFTRRQSFAILMGNALIATSASAPIGVSNIANLLALAIVGLNLNSYAALMFLPAMLGIVICAGLLYFMFRKDLPEAYLNTVTSTTNLDRSLLKIGILLAVIVRVGVFVAAALQIPPELVAAVGAGLILLLYARRAPRDVLRILAEAPWYIIMFALSMYLLVFSLRNVGLTHMIGNVLEHGAGSSLVGMIFVTGLLLTGMSCMMNNLPAVMIGTITLTDLHLPLKSLQLSYLAGVMGSDIGSLLLPMGTLASLLWFYIVRKSVDISWKEYMRVSFVVIPPSLLISLAALWGWGTLILR